MYVPRVLLCGNREKFLYATQDRPVEIIGQIKFRGAAEGRYPLRMFVEGQEISAEMLQLLFEELIDYVVMDSRDEFLKRFEELCELKLIERVVTVQTLLNYAAENFFAPSNVRQIFKLIDELNLPCTLDFDGFFAANDCHMFPAHTKICGLVRDVNFPAIKNFYAEIYPSLNDCSHVDFDAVLLTADRDKTDLSIVVLKLFDRVENFLLFSRRGSEVEAWIKDRKRSFKEISRFPAVNGDWVLLGNPRLKGACFYVSTHDERKLSWLPYGYGKIFAGKIFVDRQTAGLGDDLGDNISRLNPYLNELTVIYWIWKHFKDDFFLGFTPDKKFFSVDGRSLLTLDEAHDLLEDCDILVAPCQFGCIPLRDLQATLSTRSAADRVNETVRRYIAERQPDCLDAFDSVLDGFGAFNGKMFVTRRTVFNSYCEWIFSFIIEATNEILATTAVTRADVIYVRNALNFVAEHLFGVWLIKNLLKIKTLPTISFE